MTVLDRFEAAFERLVEGSVGRVFRSPVQPAEIGRRLERAMATGEMISVGRRVVPNAFAVAMHPDDLARFEGFLPALERQMADWLASVAAERGWSTMDEVRVEVLPEPAVPRREIRVAATFREWPGGGPANAPSGSGAAVRRMRILNGVQRGQQVLLVQPQVRVGRAPDNDIVLGDESVSRHHARIEIDAGSGTARVVDLMSTNGTRVNGRPVAASALAAGDDVEFGSVLARALP